MGAWVAGFYIGGVGWRPVGPGEWGFQGIDLIMVRVLKILVRVHYWLSDDKTNLCEASYTYRT